MTRELSQSQHSPTPTPSSSCFTKLTAARSSLGLWSSTQPILPSAAAAQALNGWLGDGVRLVKGARVGEREKGRTERDKDGKEKQMGPLSYSLPG